MTPCQPARIATDEYLPVLPVLIFQPVKRRLAMHEDAHKPTHLKQSLRERQMLHLDWVRELYFILGITAGTCTIAVVYASLEKVFPFLRGGLGRMH